MPPQNSGRKSFALTQTCKQLRSEYRPLWLRYSSIRITFDNIGQSISTFCLTGIKYEFAPKLLVISWDTFYGHNGGADDTDDYGKFVDVPFEITALLRLRAFCATSVIKFVSHRLVENKLPNMDCTDCDHKLYYGCGIDCDHQAARYWDFEILMETYSFLDTVNDILAHGAETWLKILLDT
jgi:hypothetical protein